jgi:HEAT repeat protein
VTWDDVERALSALDAEERRRGATRLAEDRGVIPTDLLLRALGDSDWRVRKEAALTAVHLAPSGDVLKALLTALEPGENVGLRNAAVEALAGYGVHAISHLAAKVGKLDADGRKLVVDTLAKSGRPEGLPVLRTLLDDEDPNVRGAAIEGVAIIGQSCADDAVPLLEAQLEKGDRYERLASLEGLNRMGAVLPWPMLEPLFGDPVLATAAVVAAGRSGDPDAVPALVRELPRPGGRISDVALAALIQLARADVAALARVRHSMKNAKQLEPALIAIASGEEESRERRRLALATVGMIGSARAAEVAVAALADDAVAGEAEAALVEMGEAAIPALIDGTRLDAESAVCVSLLARFVSRHAEAHAAVREALAADSPEVVAAALVALAEAGDADALRPAARQLAEDIAPQVRVAAQRTIQALAKRHPDEARAFAAAVTPGSPDSEAAALVIDAIGSPVRGSSDEDAAFLCSLLSSAEASVRSAALSALSVVGGEFALEPVVFALSDEEPDVRLAAARALGRMRDEDGSVIGFDRLVELSRREDDPRLRGASARALGDSGDPRALAPLGALVKAEPMVAVAALEALGRIVDPGRTELYIEALAHSDAEVVKAALRALSVEAQARGLAHVGACLDHAAWDVRRLAAELLGRAGGETALGLLRGRLALEDEPLVKDAVSLAINVAEAASGRRWTAPPPSVGGRRAR